VPRIDDFMTEFDILVNYWKIETPIGQEDGRPFAYEVDRKFIDTFYDQCFELTLIPYDGAGSNNEPVMDGAPVGNGIGGFNGTLGLETSIASFIAITGITSKTVPKSLKI
jgi:hypothetical protein